jgi:hypothetical protein
MAQTKSITSSESRRGTKSTKSAEQSPGSKNTTARRKKVTEDEIRRRAHEIYLARGGAPGFELDDWLMAKMELNQQSSK